MDCFGLQVGLYVRKVRAIFAFVLGLVNKILLVLNMSRCCEEKAEKKSDLYNRHHNL